MCMLWQHTHRREVTDPGRFSTFGIFPRCTCLEARRRGCAPAPSQACSVLGSRWREWPKCDPRARPRVVTALMPLGLLEGRFEWRFERLSSRITASDPSLSRDSRRLAPKSRPLGRGTMFGTAAASANRWCFRPSSLGLAKRSSSGEDRKDGEMLVEKMLPLLLPHVDLPSILISQSRILLRLAASTIRAAVLISSGGQTSLPMLSRLAML
mmetsp:Transcript_55622/g.104642  ORF Transcript_55622/g.104642 Transcript_55622/m.104642 type:complete len:211 (-) Transcript_55622:1042-1674(-)